MMKLWAWLPNSKKAVVIIFGGEERGLDHVWYFGLGQKENYFNLKDLADLEQGAKMVRQRDAQ